MKKSNYLGQQQPDRRYRRTSNILVRFQDEIRGARLKALESNSSICSAARLKLVSLQVYKRQSTQPNESKQSFTFPELHPKTTQPIPVLMKNQNKTHIPIPDINLRRIRNRSLEEISQQQQPQQQPVVYLWSECGKQQWSTAEQAMKRAFIPNGFPVRRKKQGSLFRRKNTDLF